VVVAAQEKLASIRLDIARHRSQIEQLQADRFSAQANVADAAAESRQRVTDLERRLEALREELGQTTTARTEYAGKVIETKIYTGAVVAPGVPMVTIQPTEGQLQAVVYIPSRQAKFVFPDMEVQLSPSNTRPEEHGYLRAKVLTVAAFPVSPLAITRSLENEALTTAMTSEGPVTELRIALLVDAVDPSGYRWSSRRGGRVSLSTGTLCTARIIVARKRPLALAVPALREALGFD
jgi:HlyD family secretion protein